MVLLDIFSVVLSAHIAYFIKWKSSEETWAIEQFTYNGSIALICFINLIIFKLLRIYDEKHPLSKKKFILNIGKGIFISFSVLAILIFILQEKTYSRIFFASFSLSTLIITAGQKLLVFWMLHNYLGKMPYSRRFLIVGNYERGKYVLDMMTSQVSFGHKIIGFMPIEDIVKENLDEIINIENIIRESCVDEIIFTLNNDKSINISYYIAMCKKAGVVCRILPSLWTPNEKSIELEELQGVPFIIIKSSSITEAGIIFKRSVDILIGFLGCMVFILTYPIVAAVIRFDSEGPVLYRQKRVGKNGRIFTLLKYRTMKKEADEILHEIQEKNEMNGPIFKIHNDPRITKVGKWLRKTSIDELPQFWNVLKGEMSLVGTRPPTPEEVKKYRLEHLKRIAIKPGITGMWQVSGRNLIKDFETILELDSQYIENWSFKMEIKIMIKTIWVVIKGKGSC